ncbi:hypothetical protein A1O1_07391 [Capronia coronata CBS 617.96]|uniref:DUF1479 domain protein n=1 Tax=Capronia coronata CBS 617.96 TaxID=1182541 RepID=W9YNC3_9EURO|nr:uncharacterized protein A1O1_07391 [Capronia coronata CBS 617.96]EXJ83764.1 hypothetical protein A1O1_07391 [Capronia coronata CBS 617.96]
MGDAGSETPWPWPEYTREEGELHPDNAKIKKEIAAEYGEENLRRSWIQVCKMLEAVTKEIREKGSSMIREFSYDDFFTMNKADKEEVKRRGCVVVRGTIPTETAEGWFQWMQKYMQDNKGVITGWPKEQPYILQLYWTKAQVEARTHPRAMALQRAIISLFHDDEDLEQSFAAPMAYADAMRMRPPGNSFTGLGPHIDAGSLCRWGDPAYRKIYEKIWQGRPDEFDAFDFTWRKRGDPAYYPGSSQSHVVRAFQGWTALSPTAPHEGSLQLFPDLKAGIAYVMLRPFFRPPGNLGDVLDAEKWSLDLDDPWFPGVWRHTPQVLSPEPFPHLRLKETMTYIPEMKPGDSVWWHMDMCHAVDVEHKGKDYAAVVYGAATPTTEMNARYMKGQLKDFLAGVSPEDFRGGCFEGGLKGFPGESAILNGEEGKRAFGYYL